MRCRERRALVRSGRRAARGPPSPPGRDRRRGRRRKPHATAESVGSTASPGRRAGGGPRGDALVLDEPAARRGLSSGSSARARSRSVGEGLGCEPVGRAAVTSRRGRRMRRPCSDTMRRAAAEAIDEVVEPPTGDDDDVRDLAQRASASARPRREDERPGGAGRSERACRRGRARRAVGAGRGATSRDAMRGPRPARRIVSGSRSVMPWSTPDGVELVGRPSGTRRGRGRPAPCGRAARRSSGVSSSAPSSSVARPSTSNGLQRTAS
jgi:hypothetical protein